VELSRKASLARRLKGAAAILLPLCSPPWNAST
jgi:hypothetical protein